MWLVCQHRYDIKMHSRQLFKYAGQVGFLIFFCGANALTPALSRQREREQDPLWRWCGALPMAFHMAWPLLSSLPPSSILHPPSIFNLSSFNLLLRPLRNLRALCVQKIPAPLSPSSRRSKKILPRSLTHHLAILKDHLPTQIGCIHARRHFQSFKRRVALRRR